MELLNVSYQHSGVFYQTSVLAGGRRLSGPFKTITLHPQTMNFWEVISYSPYSFL